MIDRVSLIFGIGVLAGVYLVLLLYVFAHFLDWLIKRYSKRIPMDQIPKKIDLSKAKNAYEASYIEGWNECIAKTLEE